MKKLLYHKHGNNTTQPLEKNPMRNKQKPLLLISFLAATMPICAMSPAENKNAQLAALVEKISCVLCTKESVSPQDPSQGLIPCNHTFHLLCIKKWLAEAESPTCPTCRTEPKNKDLDIAALRAAYRKQNQETAELHWKIGFEILKLRTQYGQSVQQALLRSTDQELLTYLLVMAQHENRYAPQERLDSYVPNINMPVPPNADEKFFDLANQMKAHANVLYKLPPINFTLVQLTEQALINQSLIDRPDEGDPRVTERINSIVEKLQAQNAK